MSGDADFITLRDVAKQFGTFRAVHDVSLTVGRGEFFSLLGASGSGKTTLLRMLAGLEDTSAGEIFIDGQPMANQPPFRRPVGMVFQTYAIFPHLDVRGNIAYGLRRQKLAPRARDALVDEMLELVQLPGYGARRAGELSGGQRQRVALARALILRPKVLLLDEPLGALDKRLREQMQIELRRLQRMVGITFVFVTHDQEEALTLSDRIAVMEGGRILQVDTPDGLYEAPVSRRVADFVGTMNFLAARVVARANGSVTGEIEGLGRRSMPAAGLPEDIDGRFCVAIRPEKIVLTAEPPPPGVDAVEGTVASRIYLGERNHYHVRIPGCDRPVAVATQNRSLGPQATHAEGQRVWLSWENAALIALKDD